MQELPTPKGLEDVIFSEGGIALVSEMDSSLIFSAFLYFSFSPLPFCICPGATARGSRRGPALDQPGGGEPAAARQYLCGTVRSALQSGLCTPTTPACGPTYVSLHHPHGASAGSHPHPGGLGQAWPVEEWRRAVVGMSKGGCWA